MKEHEYLLSKIEIYETAKSSYLMAYGYQLEKAKKYQKKADHTTKRKDHWQRLADIFTREATKTSKKILYMMDLISQEKNKESDAE